MAADMHPLITAVLLVWWSFPALALATLVVLYRIPTPRLRRHRHAR